MPGLYDKKDGLIHELGRKRMTYNFAAVDRNDFSGVASGTVDKVKFHFYFQIITSLSFFQFFFYKILI